MPRPIRQKAEFTPTEKRILEVLSDGDRHLREELLPCLNDELSGYRNLNTIIWILRNKMKKKGHDIICQVYQRKYYWRHVRQLRSMDDA